MLRTVLQRDELRVLWTLYWILRNKLKLTLQIVMQIPNTGFNRNQFSSLVAETFRHGLAVLL